MSHLTSTVPEPLKKTVLPFLQRADELDSSKQVFPAYFVRTYAAQQVLRNRDAQDPVQKSYLLDILGYLETFQKEHKADLVALDGRTIITKLALTLFDRADELERQGQCSAQICKMFFTSSILLETTKQFNDNKMDPIAAEKHKYARFVAGRMTKCLKEGAVYEPVNQSAASQFGGADEMNAAAAAAERTANNPEGEVAQIHPSSNYSGNGGALTFAPTPSSALRVSNDTNDNNQYGNNNDFLNSQLPKLHPIPGVNPAPLPPAPGNSQYFQQPSYVVPMQPPPPPAQQQQYYNNQQQPPPPPSVPPPQQQQQQQYYNYNNNNNQQPPAPPASAPAQYQQPPAHSMPPPPPPPQQQQQHHQNYHAPPPSAGSSSYVQEVNEDELDRVMNSQKWAKQAIAALQFADVQTAKTMLKRALDTLG